MKESGLPCDVQVCHGGVRVAWIPYLSRKREQIQDEIQTYRSGEIPGTA